MTLINKLIIIYREYIKRLFITVMLILICLISFYMSDRTWNSYIKTELEIKYEESTYGINPYDINKIDFSVSSDYAEERSLLQLLANISEINSYGRMAQFNTIDLNGFSSVDIIVCDINLAEMCNIGVDVGTAYAIYDKCDGAEPILLGSEYKDCVNIGERCTIFGIQCVVAGFLKDDAKWIVNDTQCISGYSINNRGVILTPDYSLFDFGESLEYTTPIYFTADYSNLDIIEEKLLMYQEENLIHASVSNEGEQLKANREANTITADKAFVATITLYIISIMALSAVTIIECLLNRKDYAIYMVNGMSRHTVYSIIIMKNIIIIVLSGIAAWSYCQWVTFNGLIPHSSEYVYGIRYSALVKSHCLYIPVIMLIETFIIVVISCMVPIIYLDKKNLSELIRK